MYFTLLSIFDEINANLAELETLMFNNWLTSTNSETKTSLDEIANYKNGLAMQKFNPIDFKNSLPVLKIKELNQGHTDENSDRCSIDISDDIKIKTGDIIFSWSGTLLLDIWSGEDAGLNQHLFKVTSNKFSKWFVFEWTKYYLREFQNIAKSKATTMGHIKRTELKKSMAIIPTELEMNKLNRILNPIFEKQIITRKETNELVKIKNKLLSRLLN
ncbi:restriction endonuclease subunit S [Fructilactobacillus frigidiflavus]|uniref:restriction endonuclease subunit S n=2 Tax=Fructilactobacillus frigidiflavus TaxID=3242688 RepID=UPI003756B0E8